jgi:hypothetical protein
MEDYYTQQLSELKQSWDPDTCNILGDMDTVKVVKRNKCPYAIYLSSITNQLLWGFDHGDSWRFFKINNKFFCVERASLAFGNRIFVWRVDTAAGVVHQCRFGVNIFVNGKVLGANEHGFIYHDGDTFSVFHTQDQIIKRVDPEGYAPPKIIHSCVNDESTTAIDCETAKSEHWLYTFTITPNDLEKKRVALSPEATLRQLSFFPTTGVQFMLDGKKSGKTYVCHVAGEKAFFAEVREPMTWGKKETTLHQSKNGCYTILAMKIHV